MLFSNAIRSKLSSLLQPWLQQEPDIELELGFLRSNLRARNLVFDPSALNRLIDDSSHLSFKRVIVGNLSARIAPWEFPSFSIEVSGVDVSLAVRELDGEGCSRGLQDLEDLREREKKAMLALLDPQGASLHETIGKIVAATSPGNWIITATTNILLERCYLCIHDICFQLQLLPIDDSLACFLKVKELSVESQLPDCSSLLRGLVGAVFPLQKESSFVLNGSGLEIDLKRKDRLIRIASSRNLFNCFRYKNLQLIDFYVHAPQINVSFSTVDFSILLLMLYMLSAKEVKHARTGRELWNTVVWRIGCLKPNPCWSLWKLCRTVVVWLRLVRAYKSLLLLLGYSSVNEFKLNVVRMTKDRSFSTSVKHQWKVVSDLEKELPTEVIERARRIARYRAALHFRCVHLESVSDLNVTCFLRILPLVSFLWKVICRVFHSTMHFLFLLRRVLHRCLKVDKTLLPSNDVDSYSKHGFTLNIGELSVTLSPESTVHGPIKGNLEPDSHLSDLGLLSFCLAIQTLCLTYVVDNTTQSLQLACGDFKVLSSLPRVLLTRGDSRIEMLRSFSTQRLEADNESQAILWTEPAPHFCLSETVVDAMNFTCRAHALFMQKYLGEMWSDWKRNSRTFEVNNIQHLEHPFLLGEIKSFLMDPYLSGPESPDHGLSQCSLTVGKLNFDFEYMSTISAALLLRQIQDTCKWLPTDGRTEVLSHTSSIIEEQTEVKWDDWFESYACGMKMAMLRMIPEKNLQIGMVVTGPKIRVSMQEQRLRGAREHDFINTQGRNGYFIIDLESIEVAVWPTSKSFIAALTGEQRFNEAAREYLWLTEPRLADTPKAEANGNCSCHGRIAFDAYLRINGLNAFFDDLVENQRSQVVGPLSVKVQSSSCRDYHHSFTAAVNALSMNLSGTAEGADILSYVDELCIFCQVLEGIFSEVSHASFSVDTIDDARLQELSRKNSRNIGRNLPAYEEKCKALILKSTKFIMDVTLNFKRLEIIMDSSRGKPINESNRKDYAASSSVTRYEDENTMLGILSVPKLGIAISVQRSCIQISSEEGFLKVLFDFSGIRSVIFRGQSGAGKYADELLHQSVNCLYEFYLSSCTLSIFAGPPGGDTFSEGTKNAVDGPGPSFAAEVSEGLDLDEGPDVQSHEHVLSTGLLPPALSRWFLINIGLNEIFLVEPSIKDVIIEAHQPNKLQCSLSIDGEFHVISCEIQGGLVFLETTALATFIDCFRAYLLYFTNFSSHIAFGRQSETNKIPMVHSESLSRSSAKISKDYLSDARSSFLPFETYVASLERKWRIRENLTIRLSRFSLILATADESGGTWELMVEADFHLKLELINSIRTFLFNLSRLTILSQNLQRSSLEQTASDNLLPRFPSFLSNDSPSPNVCGRPTQNSQFTESKLRVVDDASSSRPSVPREELLEGGVSGFYLLKHGNHILKHIVASIMAEKFVPGGDLGPTCTKNKWVGRGSVSGFDVTITLSEIQMILALATPLSDVSSKKTSGNVKQEFASRCQEQESSSESILVDGAVVAIRDLHQHMYFAVEAVENKYHLVGVIHYSLAGERALFRVRFHNQRRWRSTVSWFSLTSLHAKNEAGEPLRLNFRPGSGFVDVSSTDDRGWALWRTLSCNPQSNLGENDLDYYNQLSRKAFYLVNQKSDCGVAFVDGFPEFVKKPGHPFKVKLFYGFSPMQEVRQLDVPNAYVEGNCDTNAGDNLSNVDNEFSNFSHVNITIDTITLIIAHEVSDSNDKFPLLRGCIDNFQFNLQLLSFKTRLISTFSAAIHYLDARRNCWREIISPVEVCIFYRSRSYFHGSETVWQGVPLSFYFRMKQVHISLSELSLDVLLFSAGKMNLAGPYAVRSLMIFPNCCKVENLSGLSLVCHFDGNQDVIITGNRSTSILLRHGVLADLLPENASSVSVQLAAHGTFSTSPIHISLLDAQVFAWRTRVVSLHDSRTFPGPFIVVNVSKEAEDGVSLVISPLLRIHNESGFPMEIRFQRPQETGPESASVLLMSGDTIDDSMAVFDALRLSGGVKKALMSLSLGNFLLSFRPERTEYFEKYKKPVSIDWSEDLKGRKAVHLSGIFDKLNYRFRKAFGVESVKSSFNTVHCSLSVEGLHLTDVHFLIQTIKRNVPVTQPHSFGDTSETESSPVTLQEQKEIFLLPTVRISNLLQSEIHVLLTESHPDQCTTSDCNNTGKQATIACGSSASLYANPSILYFTVTLTEYSSKCKPVNSGDWVKKLRKQKTNVHYLDVELNFVGGRYFASLRLSCTERGILEATVFTSYMMRNVTDLTLFCYASHQKPPSREEVDSYGLSLPPELGSLLPPGSTSSWFSKSKKIYIKQMEDKASETLMDLDKLPGFTELCLEAQDESGVKHIAKLGVSLKSCLPKAVVPSLVVSMVPRYIISNESEDGIIIRQCYLEDDSDGTVAIDSQQKAALLFRTDTYKRKEIGFFDSMLKHHRNWSEDSWVFIQFCLKEDGWSWSGPICVASLGRFFVKFRRSVVSHGYETKQINRPESNLTRYAAVHIVGEDSSLVLHFHMPPKSTLPYRIENCLREASITYYQKDSAESEILGSGSSTEYAWDDLNLPHKLVVQINNETHLLREINVDKVCAWKPLFKTRKTRGLALHTYFDKTSGDKRRANFDGPLGLEMLKVGYEVYADGSARALRICEFSDSCKEVRVMQPHLKIQCRVSFFAVHLLEKRKQDVDASNMSIYSTIIVARLDNITLDSIFTEQHKFNQIRVQTLNVDEKWEGAPFAAMIRKNRIDYNDMNENILYIVFNLQSTVSNVKQVQYSSIVLQPIDLNFDEETLMRLVPFWRTSLSYSNTQSQQYYFKHFEIHPIKIVASFLPGTPYSSYSSAQETLRSVLHNVIKIPTVKNMVVELNGVLLTHALVTARELVIKCAQHYSWYAMRAIYIAKGSPLLPPAFASIFDDSASSSLDVFFDPSSGIVNLPGLTLGMFKFISKRIDAKGFSGTKRYFGDLGKTMKTIGSNVLFAAVTEISDNVVRGAETSGFNGMVNGFHQGILKLAMEPSLLGTFVMEGGPNRKIKLDRSPGVDELYIEGYLQAMLDVMYKQEYLRVRVIDGQVLLKNLPPNSSLINEIMEHVKSFLVSKALLKGDPSLASRPLRHLRGESEWKIGPTVLTLCEHLFVSFAIRILRKQASKVTAGIRWKRKSKGEDKDKEIVLASSKENQDKLGLRWGVGKFILSGMVAYIDGRLCRCIPNALVRRIVSGFLLSFLDKDADQ